MRREGSEVAMGEADLDAAWEAAWDAEGGAEGKSLKRSFRTFATQ